MIGKKKNMSLALKMSLGFGVPLLLMAVIVITVSVLANRVQRNALVAKDETAILTTTAKQMKLDVVQIQQWLTDISATRGQDGLDDGFEEAEESYQSFLLGLDVFRQMYTTKADSAGLQQLGELRSAVEDYYQTGKKMARAYIDGGPEEGNKLMGAFDETAARVGQSFVEAQDDELAEALAAIAAAAKLMRASAMAMGLAALVLGASLAWLTTRSITKPVGRIITRLVESSEQVASASGQVSSASQSLAEGATEQAAGLQETSSSLEEMSSMTKQNADNARQANMLAGEARKSASTGAESMHRMNGAIQEIQKSSDQTAKIIKVIDDIAFQTNLLALNAAVEAARAGEAGKGFAVVAEEVRNLAMRSAEAAKNTSNMIEESVKNAKNGVDIAADVGKVLEEIVQSVGKTTDLVSEIAAASQEQAQGIDQVNTAVSQMDKVTQQNAASAEESASASEELSAQAASMNDIVGQLVTLVGGSAASGKDEGATPSRRSEPGRTFGRSDETWHRIATEDRVRSGRASAKRNAGANPIRFDDEDESLDDFNA